MKSLIGIAIISFLLSGCFAKAGRPSGVQHGMSKQEVVAIMGAPVSVSTHGNSQYFSYSVCDTDNQTLNGIMRPYVVRLIDGRVESYGTTGDVGSLQTPTARYESDPMVKQDVHTKEPVSDPIVKQDVRTKEPVDLHTELLKLKQLKDTGLLTEEEFRIQKRRVLERR